MSFSKVNGEAELLGFALSNKKFPFLEFTYEKNGETHTVTRNLNSYGSFSNFNNWMNIDKAFLKMGFDENSTPEEFAAFFVNWRNSFGDMEGKWELISARFLSK